MGIDIWEVLDAAETKPFGFMRFNPGPGWGGHCIPLDPFYLAWKAREVRGAHEVHRVRRRGQRQHAAIRRRQAPAGPQRPRQGREGEQGLVLGVAYKKDTDDPRESPAFEIIEELLRLGAMVSYHDPHVPVAPRMRSWPDLPAMTSKPLTAETLAATDAVVVVTDHTAVDYALLAGLAPLIVDTRGVWRKPAPNIVKA